jgi:hypothetical protein
LFPSWPSSPSWAFYFYFHVQNFLGDFPFILKMCRYTGWFTKFYPHLRSLFLG